MMKKEDAMNLKESSVEGFFAYPYDHDMSIKLGVSDDEGNWQGEPGGQYESNPYSGLHYRLSVGGVATHYCDTIEELREEWNRWCENVLKGDEIQVVARRHDGFERREPVYSEDTVTIHEGLFTYWSEMFYPEEMFPELKEAYQSHMGKQMEDFGFMPFPSEPVMPTMICVTDEEGYPDRGNLGGTYDSDESKKSFYCIWSSEHFGVHSRAYDSLDGLREAWNKWCKAMNSSWGLGISVRSCGGSKYKIDENIIGKWPIAFDSVPIRYDALFEQFSVS